MRICVTLTNRYAVIPRIDPEMFNRLRDFWSFSPKGLWFMPRYKTTKMLKGQRAATVVKIDDLKAKPQTKKIKSRLAVLQAGLDDLDEKLAVAWNGKISLLERSAVPAGLFRATWRDAENALGIKFAAVKHRETVPFVSGMPPAPEQYQHQNVCVERMLDAVPKGGGIILAATSSGKTSIAARLFSRVMGHCLFVVDQVDLLYQQQQEIETWLNTPVGVVGDSEFKPERVTVATIQTLYRHCNRSDFKSWFSNIDIVVVDELHEQMAKRNFKVLNRVKPVAVFGLTATLQLTKKEVSLKAYAFAGPVIFRFPIKDGVERGVLAKGHVLQMLFSPVVSVEGVPYQSELALEVIQNDLKISTAMHLTEEMVIRQKRHVVILVDRVKHLHDVHDVLWHIPHGLAYGDIPVEQRREFKENFEDEDIKLLIANKVFKKGVSIKRIDAMIDMAEGRSKNDVVQKYGRGIRLHDDKTELIYVDFGTGGHGRFARSATSRRRALRKAGIEVTVVKDIETEAQAVSALRKFIRKVTNVSSS